MIGADFHQVSVITTNYNKWLPLVNHMLYPSVMVSHAPCVYLPHKA